MSTAALLSQAQDRVLPSNNPVAEIFQRTDAGLVLAQPRYIPGQCAGGDLVGAFVYISGVVQGPNDPKGAPTYSPIFSTCDPTAASKRIPMGMIEYKSGDTQCVVRTLEGDVAVSGIVAGTRYVIGTDGLPAKVGDSTYPSTVKPVEVGIGIVTGRLLLGIPSAGGQGGWQAGILTDSAAITANGAETDFDKTIPFPALTAKAGDTLEIEGSVRVTAAATNATGILKVYLGSIYLYLSLGHDAIDAGDVLFFKTLGKVRSVANNGTVTLVSSGMSSLAGDVADKRSFGGGRGAQTFDGTVAQTIKAAWTWSAANCSCVLQQFDARIK